MMCIRLTTFQISTLYLKVKFYKMNSFAIIFSFTLLFNFVICQTGKCYQDDDHPYEYFASKTVYNHVSAKYNYTLPYCKPLQLWLLSRHGTRHPAASVIEKISSLTYYKNQIIENSTLCQADLEAIKKWDFNLTEKDGNKLNSQGVDDLLSLGLKLKNLYPDIFNEPYNPETFKVLSSPKSRSVDSAFYFLKSAFGMNVTAIPLMTKDDTKLNVTKFKKINDNDDMEESTVQEVKAFHSSEDMQKLLYRVSKTMGLDRILTLDTVKIMYDSCRYEKSWRINFHPAWCAVFSQQDLEILEYEEDLKYYYVNGYGDSYNKRIGCPIVKDLMKNFRAKSRSGVGPKGVFYFGHSSNVLGAVVRLGAAERDAAPLLATNFGGARNRKWKTSWLSPFGANVMAVLYDCGGEHNVAFYINGVPTPVVGNDQCVLCPWPLIDRLLGPIVDDPACDMAGASSSTALRPVWTVVVTLLLLLLPLLPLLVACFDAFVRYAAIGRRCSTTLSIRTRCV